jgi:hypothetical protein
MVVSGMVACMVAVSQSGRDPVGGAVGPASVVSGIKTDHRLPVDFILPAWRLRTP